MPLVTKSAYAKHRKEQGLPGGSPAAVHYAIQDGRIKVTRGKIELDQADLDWAKNTSQAACAAGIKGGAGRAAQRKEEPPKVRPKVSSAPLPQPAIADLNTSKANKEFYESELSRLKFEEKEGTLIPASVVRKVLYEAGRIVRAGHDDIVSQLAPDLASETAISLVERILKKALDALDNTLAERIVNLESSLLDEEKASDDDE